MDETDVSFVSCPDDVVLLYSAVVNVLSAYIIVLHPRIKNGDSNVFPELLSPTKTHSPSVSAYIFATYVFSHIKALDGGSTKSYNRPVETKRYIVPNGSISGVYARATH